MQTLVYGCDSFASSTPECGFWLFRYDNLWNSIGCVSDLSKLLQEGWGRADGQLVGRRQASRRCQLGAYTVRTSLHFWLASCGLQLQQKLP